MPIRVKTVQEIKERFYKKFIIKDSGCWEWICGKHKSGYAEFYYGESLGNGRKRGLAHIFSYKIHKGKIPEGKILDHLCRNRACVNPKHLEVVDYAENIRRGLVTKLTYKSVEKIRKLYLNGVKQVKLAKVFGVGQHQISKIVNFKRWNYVCQNSFAR